MKKNILGNTSFNSHLPPCPSSLFANKQAKEHVLEELKKGTLFQHNTRLDTKDQSSLSSRHEDGRCWLNEIKLGIEQPCEESVAFDQERGEVSKSMNGLPRLYKKAGFSKQNIRIHLETRCNKITCLSRKLARVGAWNEENSNNISQNVSKLEQSLLLGQNDLTQNDFERVEGLHYHGKLLENSIQSLHSSSLLLGKTNNPFSQFPLYSSTFGDWSEFKKRSLRRKKHKYRCQPTEGHYVPSFLLQSLYVQTFPKT